MKEFIDAMLQVVSMDEIEESENGCMSEQDVHSVQHQCDKKRSTYTEASERPQKYQSRADTRRSDTHNHIAWNSSEYLSRDGRNSAP